ncbi:hypothetical protein [Actinoplanes sichuanensis]|uniref:hypothetical protein n=1 Tax=Actinoplanes sichuanensis TaxID=512349 RepID=UPI002955D945|nr:hypothetical protein [Actinoplanes sichuanensis]
MDIQFISFPMEVPGRRGRGFGATEVDRPSQPRRVEPPVAQHRIGAPNRPPDTRW